MKNKFLDKSINRRQLLGFLGVSVALAPPALAGVSRLYGARQMTDHSQALKSMPQSLTIDAPQSLVISF